MDFAFVAIDSWQQMATGILPADVADTLRRGARTVLDKDGLVAQMQTAVTATAPAPHVTRLPTEAAFLEVVNDFNDGMARACYERSGPRYLVPGTISGRVVDSRVLEGLRGAFAHYGEDDIWRALFATMDLFRWLALETANQLGYSFPAGDKQVSELVNRLYSEKS